MGAMREGVKSIVRMLGLYGLAVKVWSRLEDLYGKAKDLLQYFYSPFPNAIFMRKGEKDGLPFPPVSLVYLVTNTYRYDWFYESGVLGARSIREILKKNDHDIAAFETILDFGCGCGRMMRQWRTLRGPRLYGADCNPVLVSWCTQNLPFAEFITNNPSSPVPYEDKSFDFIYAISVFTHLTEEMGLFWVDELARVLKPGGVIYMTVMGGARVAYLPRELRKQFASGHLVVTDEDRMFTNACAAYHPERYVREMLPDGLKIMDFIPGGAKDAHQDVFLLGNR